MKTVVNKIVALVTSEFHVVSGVALAVLNAGTYNTWEGYVAAVVAGLLRFAPAAGKSQSAPVAVQEKQVPEANSPAVPPTTPTA